MGVDQGAVFSAGCEDWAISSPHGALCTGDPCNHTQWCQGLHRPTENSRIDYKLISNQYKTLIACTHFIH